MRSRGKSVAHFLLWKCKDTHIHIKAKLCGRERVMVWKKCVCLVMICMILAGCTNGLMCKAANAGMWSRTKEELENVWQEEWLTVSAPAQTELYAQAAVLMDAASGRVLYEKNGNEVLAMASTTKIMTCIIALENGDLDEVVDISAYAASMPKVKLYVKKGEQYTLRDLLYSLMLESHNDAAVAIAEHIGKGFLSKDLQEKSVADFSQEESKQAVAAFADLMNEKAEELKCKDTWFITPNGLDATETFRMKDGSQLVKNHSTSATDLATIMSYCVLHSSKNREFLQITQTTSYTVTSKEGRTIFCTNHNAFLSMMEGAISGKTGFTNKAGYCYVGALERDGKTYVVALLACGWPNNKSYKWSDTKKLMNYGIEEFEYAYFSGAEVHSKVPDKLLVEEGQTDYVGQQAYVQTRVIPAEGGNSAFGEQEKLLLREDEQIQVRYNISAKLQAPVQKGAVVGTIFYEINGEIYKQEDIIITADIKKIDLEWCVIKILHDFLEI